MGVTGSGKTFTMANVIQEMQRPALVISHNKTLAAQLYSEFKEFFPYNAVHYFVSYYDYYQPEAYIPQRDIYIEKDASINEEIDRLRLATTSSLVSRSDVIIVASVSSIYGLGSPDDYRRMVVSLRKGEQRDRDQMLSQLVDVLYQRNDIAFERSKFRVRGDSVEIWPSYEEYAYRVEFWGDEIEQLSIIHPVSGEVLSTHDQLFLSSQALCHSRVADQSGDRRDQAGTRRATRVLPQGRQTARSPATQRANPVRHRNDGTGWTLSGN
jgi:excinuclease ABC subunit B